MNSKEHLLLHGYPFAVNSPAMTSVETLAVNCLRGLAIDAVQKANSGHPGMPMGCAPLATTLWTRHLKHNPKNPKWLNRDRFVLSAGHGSMLLYGLLFATGYDLSLDDIKNFRQWGSRTPGHPENHLTPGVEMATGPLGQGISTAVGMAMAEAHLAAQYNRPGHEIISHFTYVICSDGDLMEGVAQEACSLAGHLQLGKLICLYDDNQITIDGSTEDAFTENTAGKFHSLGWHVQHVDGMDMTQVDHALTQAREHLSQPSLIICKTTIGYGSPNKAGKSSSHGSPLGPEEIKLTKANYELPTDEDFYWPSEVAQFFDATQQGADAEAAWQSQMTAYSAAFPAEAAALTSSTMPEINWPAFPDAIATRNANGACQNAVAESNPHLFGGCADLTDNVMTRIKSSPLFSAQNPQGRNIAFGVREHAMAAAANGITLHGVTRGFTGTFLIFSDYCRPSIRLAALMECPTLFLFSHDSIGLGEDGPTHQPVEQTMSLRLIPNLNVMRPADANEMAVCWDVAIGQTKTPSVLISTRQALPILTPAFSGGDHPAKKGAYVLAEASTGTPERILAATGSEVSLAMDAKSQLEASGIPTRVVSMPSWFLFEQQSAEYKNSVLVPGVRTISIEAGVTVGWGKYAQAHVGLDHFGASAPGSVLFREFGFTPENVVAIAKG